MKLVSLNIEGKKHLDKIKPFLLAEQPDVIGLMEAPKDIQSWLQTQGYQTTFAPLTIRTWNNERFPEGVVVASKLPHTASTHYYYRATEVVTDFDSNDKLGMISHPVVFAEIENFLVGFTHFTWNPHGETADEKQTTDLNTLLQYTATLPAHILCGDFNIPRHFNTLYETLTTHYNDEVPQHYTSSLDRDLHRAGGDPTKKKLFDDFMVDYVFTQTPYQAADTRLVFGLSDHAAVVTHITNMKM